MADKLIFVYNANAGALNAVLDSAHKVLSPDTYSCSLCAITYGVFSENKVWANYRKSATIEMEFLHKDEFLKQYRSKWLPKYTFPIVLVKDDERLDVFITTKELDEIASQEDLIVLVSKRLNQFNAQ